MRQFEAGDVLASGVVAEQLKGFRLTNAPHRQVDVFGLIPIRADPNAATPVTSLRRPPACGCARV
jgi:hypothetical protein